MGHLHNSFTVKSGAAKPVLPLGRDIFSFENNTRRVEDVLADLGLHPFVFDQGSDFKIHVLQNNAHGQLACAFHYGHYGRDQIFAAFKAPPDTMAPFARVRSVLAPDMERLDYSGLIGLISKMPERLLENTQGDANLLKAIIIGHEMEHFEHPPTLKNKPVYTLQIETLCDISPLMLLDQMGAACGYSSEVLQTTIREFRYARAVAPILDAIMANRFEYADKKNLHEHATALMLDEKSQRIFNEDDFAQCAWEANVEAGRRVNAVIDHSLQLPYYLAGYVAAKTVLAADSGAEDDYAAHVLALYVEAAEYFSPELAARALEIAEKSRRANNPEHTHAELDVSLELS